jgi:hypothetical protein
MLKQLFSTAAVALLVSLFASPAVACSLIACENDGIEVRGEFAVMVTHDRKPLNGAQVEISTGSASSPIFSGATGSVGVLHVTGVSAGDYSALNFPVPVPPITAFTSLCPNRRGRRRRY